MRFWRRCAKRLPDRRTRDASGHDQCGDDVAAFGDQNVVGAARGARIHHLETDARPMERCRDARMQELLPFACPEQHDFGRALKQPLEVRLGECVESLRRETGRHPIAGQDDVLPVFLRADPNPAGAHAGDEIGTRGLQVKLQGCLEIAAEAPAGCRRG